MKGTRYLWINNLTSKITAEDIRSVFHSYGKIQDVRIHEKNGSIGAVVAFMDVTAATKAHEETIKLDGLLFNTEFCDSNGCPGLDQLGNSDIYPKSDFDKISNDLSSSALDSSKCGLSSDVESISQPTTRNSSPKKSHEQCSQRRSRSTSYSSVQSGISSRTSSKHNDKKHDQPSLSYKSHFKKETREKYRSQSSTNRSPSPKYCKDNSHYVRHDHEINWCKNPPKGLKVTHLPQRSSDTAIRDGLFHEYKKHGKILSVTVEGRGHNRHAIITFKKIEDAKKAFETSREKVFFAKPIMVEYHKGYEHEDPELCHPEELYDEYHPKATRTLFVGNLDYEVVSEEALYDTFSKYGEIIDIDIKTQNNQPKHCYSFIQYTDIRSVVRALQSDDTIRINGYTVKLGFGKSHPTNCLWLNNLAPAVNTAYLTNELSQIASVDDVILDRVTMKALVFFKSTDDAQNVLKELKKQPLAGRKVQVDFASSECQSIFIGKTKHKYSNGSSYPMKRPNSHKATSQTSHSYKMLPYNEENVPSQSTSQRKRFYPKNHLMRKKYATTPARHKSERNDSRSESYDSSSEKDKQTLSKYPAYDDYNEIERKFNRKHRHSYVNESIRNPEYSYNTHDPYYSKSKDLSTIHSKSIDPHKRRSYSRTESVSSLSHENDCVTNYNPDEHSKSIKYYSTNSSYPNSSDPHKLRTETTLSKRETSCDKTYGIKPQTKNNGSIREAGQQNQSLSILERERNMLLLELSKLEKGKSNMDNLNQMREPPTKHRKTERSNTQQQQSKAYENEEPVDHPLQFSSDIVHRLLQKAKETSDVSSIDRFHLEKSISLDESERRCGRLEDQEQMKNKISNSVGDKKGFIAQRSQSVIEDTCSQTHPCLKNNDLAGSFLRDPRLNSQHYQNIHGTQSDVTSSENNGASIAGCDADILTQLIHEVVLKSQLTDSSPGQQQLDHPSKRNLINAYHVQNYSQNGNLAYSGDDLTLEERIKMLDARINHSDSTRTTYDYGKFKIRKKSDEVKYLESLAQPTADSYSYCPNKSKTDTTEFVKQMLTHTNSAFACPNLSADSKSNLAEMSHRTFCDFDQFNLKMQNRGFLKSNLNDVEEKSVSLNSAFSINSDPRADAPVRSILKKDLHLCNQSKSSKSKSDFCEFDDSKSYDGSLMSSKNGKICVPQSPLGTPSDSVTPIMSPKVPSNCVTKPRSGCKKVPKRKSQDELTIKQMKISKKSAPEEFFGPTAFLYANKKALLKKKNEFGLLKDQAINREKPKKSSKPNAKLKSKKLKHNKEIISQRFDDDSSMQSEKAIEKRQVNEESLSDDDQSSTSNNAKFCKDDDMFDKDISYESMYDKIKRRKNKEKDNSSKKMTKGGKTDDKLDSEEASSTDDTHNENQEISDDSRKPKKVLHCKKTLKRSKSNVNDAKPKLKKGFQNQSLKERRKKKQSNVTRKRIQKVNNLLSSGDPDIDGFTDQSQASVSFNSPIPNFLSDDSKLTPSTERMENSDNECGSQNVKSSQDLSELYPGKFVIKNPLSSTEPDISEIEVIEEEIIFDAVEEGIGCEETIGHSETLDKSEFETGDYLDNVIDNTVNYDTDNTHNKNNSHKDAEISPPVDLPSSSTDINLESTTLNTDTDSDIEREAFRRYKKLPVSYDSTNFSSSGQETKAKYASHPIESKQITSENLIDSTVSPTLCESNQNSDPLVSHQLVANQNNSTDYNKSNNTECVASKSETEIQSTLFNESKEPNNLENTCSNSLKVCTQTGPAINDSIDQVISDVSRGLFDQSYYIAQWYGEACSVVDTSQSSIIISQPLFTPENNSSELYINSSLLMVEAQSQFLQSKQDVNNYYASNFLDNELHVSCPNAKNKAMVTASPASAFTPIISSSSSNSLLINVNNSADFDAEKENAPQAVSSTSLCHSIIHPQVSSSNQPTNSCLNYSFSNMSEDCSPTLKSFESVRAPQDDRLNYKQVIESLGEELKNSLSNCGEFPTIWKGNLALKNDEVYIQMHFINGNSELAKTCLNISNQQKAGSNGQPLQFQSLRIVQRMRLESSQLDGVERKMINEQEFCACWAIASGSTTEKLFNMNSILKNNFIKYLLEKGAAGIINIVDPSNNQTAYIVHIFPPCEFSAKHLETKTPQLMQWINRHCVPYLFIAITTV